MGWPPACASATILRMLAHLKTLLLVSEAFPQSPVKPLGVLTRPPVHTSMGLNGINADLFIPARPGPHPALIFAMGVKASDQDRPLILKFAETMSRLGFIVLWPRLALLDEGQDLAEDPSTFVEAFRYLEGRQEVDASRISFLGFSIGSSVSLVAACHPDLAERVRAVVFFGGFYDVESYVTAIATGTTTLNGVELPWRPSEEARNHFREVVEATRAYSVLKVLNARSRAEAQALLKAADPVELAGLRRLSPFLGLDQLRAPVFILHDKGDTYVPYTESVALDAALDGRERTMVLVDLFEHVQPNRPLTWRDVGELMKLYGFVRRALAGIT